MVIYMAPTVLAPMTPSCGLCASLMMQTLWILISLSKWWAESVILRMWLFCCTSIKSTLSFPGNTWTFSLSETQRIHVSSTYTVWWLLMYIVPSEDIWFEDEVNPTLGVWVRLGLVDRWALLVSIASSRRWSFELPAMDLVLSWRRLPVRCFLLERVVLASVSGLRSDARPNFDRDFEKSCCSLLKPTVSHLQGQIPLFWIRYLSLSGGRAIS